MHHNSTRDDDWVPRDREARVSELASRLTTIVKSCPEGEDKRAWTELCLLLADRVGPDGSAYKSNAVSGRAEDVAWKEPNSVQSVLTFSVNPGKVDGEWRRGQTGIEVGTAVTDAAKLCDNLGIDYGTAAKTTTDTTTEQGLRMRLDETRPGAGTSGGQTAASPTRHKRGGALGYGNSPDDDAEDSGSASADDDLGGSESMSKNHFSGSLRSKVPVPKPVLDAFDEAFDAADVSEEYRPVLRHVFAHVYYCQTRMPDRYGDGVPLSHGLLKQACREAEGVDVPTRTEDIWESVEGELLAVSDYIYREEGVGRSREFRLVEDLMRRLDGALENGYEYKTRYNLIDGKRLRSGFQTALTYDGEHSWEQRSTFIYKTLKRLRGQRDVVNKAAAENHLDRLEAEKQAAQERYDRLQAELDQLKGQILEEGKSLSESEQKRLSDARETVCKAGREKERAESRWRQDARIWADIIAQGLEEAEDQPEGICEYETAYEVQPGSGRLTCICGLQNASEEMKAAAAKGTVHYRNVDIKSSQTEAIIQEMEMAVSMGADLNLSAIKGYIEAGGKDALADEHGIYRDRWKRPEHSVKFGAGFNHDTYAAALGAAKGKVLSGIKDDDDDPDFSQLYQFENESGEAAWHRAVYKELPTMAAVARDWADDDEIVYDDPEEVYSILQDAYGEMAEELDAWRDWLVDEYWTEAGQHGSQFGYFVSNPCSLPFSIHDTRLADSNGEDEEISRYNQKAGFATSRLQGSESAFMHALALIQDDFEYEFLRNEHDGAVVLGEIPEEAVQMARLISGFHRAELEEKPFEGHNSNNTETNDTETCDTTTSKDPSAQNQLEKPSKSPTSPNGGKSGAGSANGTTGPGGAKSERTPSGSAQVSPEQSATTSGTTCEGTDPSDSSTGRSRKETSKTSSGATTGATSPEEKAVQARLERKRRVREGEVPTGMQQALEEGFSKAEWKWAQRNAAASAA